MCSRGFVTPLFIEQIKSGKPLTVTDLEMTRFMMSLDEAVDLVMFAFEKSRPRDIMVQKMPACTIAIIVQVVKMIFHKDNEICCIGTRHGEKKYETLLTKEECLHAFDMGDFYRVPADNRDLNYEKYFEEGKTATPQLKEFNSNNTRMLDKEEMKALFMKQPYVQEQLRTWNI